MPSASPAPAISLTRDDVLRLSQGGQPWDFLPVAAVALDQAPEDHGLRFLTSANLARLGLKTMALEQLDKLPPAAQTHQDVAALRKALSALPDDLLSPDQLRCNCEANLMVLSKRGLDFSKPLGTWTPAPTLRALDGNIIRRPTGAGLSECLLTDHITAASQFIESERNLTKPACIILEGLSPPWMFQRLHHATPTQSLGFRQPILIVQPDLHDLLDALSIADLSAQLADDRVHLFAGPEAPEQLRAHLLSRVDYQISSVVVPASRTGATPTVQSVIEQTLAAQESEFTRLRAQTDAIYAARHEQWWARRYREAAAGGPPLRILIPTCRYSTFIQHSSADLCATLRRQGHTAELYREPDDMSRLCGVGYLRTFERFQPDLVVLINFPRASMGAAIPANVPYVCWIQDSMGHLFDPAIGAAQGPLDFLIGHTLIELFHKYGYPTHRAMPISVVADETKFFPTPNLRHSTTDIAFVSHHSETPEAMHQRLCRETNPPPGVAKAFERLYPDIQQAAANASAAPALLHIQDAVATRLREALGQEPDQRTQTLVFRQFAAPLADRMLRHQTLAWAAAIARRRNWRLNIYGRGWDKHPTLAPFAQPELAHGEDLRTCYQAAAAHLHISGSTLTHQRVIECFLSGGLCLSRLHRDAISSARINAHIALLHRPPDVIDEANSMTGYVIADHPEAMALANTVGAAGHPYDGPVLWFTNARALSYRRFASVMAPDQDPTFLLRDLSDTTFSTEAELQTLLTRAVENPSWRCAVIDMVARRARQFLTHDALARRTLDLVRTSLGAHALREAV
jgi:hypothetical protein